MPLVREKPEGFAIKISTKSVVRATVLVCCMTLLVMIFAVEARPINEVPYLQYFTIEEFADKITGQVNMDRDFLLKLDELRRLCGFPIYINSGYRSRDHPLEKIKYWPGTHFKGIAVDIHAIDNYHRNLILRHATKLGFTGFGIYPSHIHLDTRKSKTVIWVLE